MSPTAIAKAPKRISCEQRSRGKYCLLLKGHSGFHEYPAGNSEREIQEACAAILELDGWRRIRMEATWSEKKRKGVGEVGMADDLFIRYWSGYRKDAVRDIGGIPDLLTEAQVLWIEWKRLMPSKRGKTWGRATQAAIHQKAWHALERSRGALTWIGGEDFPASIEGFREHYKKSGLMRRNILS